eukprot:494633_1
MGTTLSDLETKCAFNCCGSAQTTDYIITSEIARTSRPTPPPNRTRNTYTKSNSNSTIYQHHLTRSRHTIDSIEPTEVESSNADYTHIIIDYDYTHKTPTGIETPITATTATDIDEMDNSMEPTPNRSSYPPQNMDNMTYSRMEFMEESIDGHSISLMSEKIIAYDLSNTPSQPRHSNKSSKHTITKTQTSDVFIAPKIWTDPNDANINDDNNNDSINSTKFKKKMFGELINDQWNYQEVIALISYNDKHNGIWDDVIYDPILSQRHNNMNQCIDKYQQIVQLIYTFNNQKSGNLFEQEANLQDMGVYESNPKMVNDGRGFVDQYKDEAGQIWNNVLKQKRMLLKRESSRLVLSQKAFKKKQMRGFMVGTEIVDNKPLPMQIHDDIRRVYYRSNDITYVLNISELDDVNTGHLGIFAYNIDTFEYILLAKVPEFNQNINNMYFSLYYDEIMKQIHVLCGPRGNNSSNEGHIWCIYDIENKTCDPDMVELTVNKPPIIKVCNGQRFIFNGTKCIKYDKNKQKFIKFNAPTHYIYVCINEMISCYNIVYVQNEQRIYLFGGYTNATLCTDIWYINIDSNKHKWN